MSPTARLIHLKNKNQRTPTRKPDRNHGSGEKSFVEKMQSSEKQVMRERATRTSHSYYPKHRIEEEPSMLEQTYGDDTLDKKKGIKTLTAETNHGLRTQKYNSKSRAEGSVEKYN